MIAATILAAGKSTRMGSPKALLRIGPRTFLQCILETCRAAGLESLVVLEEMPSYILPDNELREVTRITNDEMRAGPIGSIRSAIRHLEHRADVRGLLVWPVDYPLVTLSTVRSLVGEDLGATPIRAPSFRGRRGHPVLFGRTVFDELLAAPDSKGARAVVRRDSQRVTLVPVDDEWVAAGINTPADYKAMIARLEGTPPKKK